MRRILTILCIIVSFCFANSSLATVLLVENTLNSGSGSLRDVVAAASNSDTILINVKGTITLESPIDIDGFTSLSIIGPYPKHNSITSIGGWTGALFHITDSEDILISGLGFIGGDITNRHVRIEDCNGTITFERCLFEGSVFTGGNGGSVYITSSDARFSSCSFIHNTANVGGAIRAQGNSEVSLINSTLSGNTAASNAGAISANGNTTLNLLYCTVVENSSLGSIQAIRANSATTVAIENMAMGNNGSGRQILLQGSVTNNGGNRILLNSGGEATFTPTNLSDLVSDGLNMGLRSEILEDGFGLKYWTIVDDDSDLINTAVISALTPDSDCRNAPRSLKGDGATALPDAGAAEYTHLRVTNTSGGTIDNSFRWALEAARRKDEMHYIEFDIPGIPSDISMGGEGIVSGDGYIIDGFSQHGSAIPGPHEIGTPGLTRPVLMIDLVNGGSHNNGIEFDSGAENSIIQGISIQAFSRNGVESNVREVSIFGCEIGINDAGGENGNERVGIKINNGENVIGGWEHWMRNVVSGNGPSGTEEMNIRLQFGNDNKIYGNVIGGSPNGLSSIFAATQTRFGIYCETDHNQIGNSLINTKNIIIDNEYGIYFSPGGDNNTVQGNNIGIGWDGATAVGNFLAGISLGGADGIMIGGFDLSQGNIIAHNESGIEMFTSFTAALNNSILGNSIHNNIEQGIDLENDDLVLTNDGTTSALQQNYGLDFPVITSTENCDGTQTTTNYTLTVPTGQDYRVEFFSNTSPDPTNGEGQIFRGAQTVSVTTNPQAFSFDHGILIAPGTSLSMTATQLSSGSTSEFGTNAVVTAPVGDPTISYLDICPGDTAKPEPGYEPGGAFRFVDPAPVGVSINSTTGYITNAQEGNAYKVIYDLGGTCVNDDTTEFAVIVVEEDFIFDDFCILADSSASGPVIDVDADADSAFFILLGPADGASINLETGIIYSPNEGTTYTVVDSVRNLGCWQSDTLMVTAIEVNEAFTFPDICIGSDGDPVVVESLIDTFYFEIDLLDAATIDPYDGTISGGVGGTTYTVTRIAFEGACSDTATTTVSIINPDASFTYDDFCPGLPSIAPTPTTPGGVWSFASPPLYGETMDADGIIYDALEDSTYTVEYTITESGCTVSQTRDVHVTKVAEGFAYLDFCIVGDSSALGPITDVAADPDSSFFILLGPADGASINLESGIIYGPNEGTTYTVVDSVRNLGCWQSDTVMVTAIDVNEAFTFPDICIGSDGDPLVEETLVDTFYFEIDLMDAATIDPYEGTITGGVGGTTYTVTRIAFVGACTDTATATTTIINPDASFTYNDFCPGLPSVAPTPTVGGGEFSFETPPLYGETMDADGIIYDALEDSTYNVIYTVTEDGCSVADTIEVHVILVPESFTYPDFCVVGDSSASGPIIEDIADPDSSFFILLGPVVDESINLETGIIYFPVEGNTYTVVDSTRNMGCWQTDTVTVTAIEVDEAFVFPNICFGSEGGPTVAMDLLDTFYFETDLMDGAMIEPYDGTLSEGVGGTTYEVTRIAFVGACSDTATTAVSIIEPDASFVYDDFCPGLPSIAPTPTNPGGDWSFGSPPLYGETMDDDGIIYDALEDSLYLVTYTITEEGCSDADTLEVHVYLVEQEFFHSDFCWEASSDAADAIVPDGTYSFGTPAPDDGATIEAESGIVENATEGTMYEIVHTIVTDEGCSQSDSLFITALGVDESFNFDDFCPGTESPAPDATTPGGTFEFFELPGDGATINTTTGVITNPVEGNSYEVMYSVETETGGCSESSVEVVLVISVDESFSFENFCAESEGSPIDIATDGGEFSFAPPVDGDPAEIDEETGLITMATPGTVYAIQYTVGECMEQDTNYVTALASDIASFDLDDHCANIELEAVITGTTGGQFGFDTDPGDGSTINDGNGIILGSSGGDYMVSYTTEGSLTSCPDTIVKTVTLFAIPSITDLNSDIDLYCPDMELGPINAVSDDALKLYWYETNTEGEIIDSSFSYTPTVLNLGNNVYHVRPYNSDGCYGEFKSYTLFLSDTAGMQAASDFQICLGSPAQLEAYGGATYEWTTDVPLADYSSSNPVAFSLNEEAYIVSIKNEDDCEVIDTINVGFLPRNECTIDIYNAFSPNEDGKNDFWYIDNLINFTPNTVYIYNRWGDEVNEISNYDNINSYWDGKDKNGNELPPNTYFYVVVTDNADQSQAGWVQLVR